ncbi:MAG: rRNA maturation RNase YbeY [Micavibrio aeruginosavorus]|uniref:Endoribonuclease YbeY n=1 Tax=Micavibrio aeruginosavorus TaxID=349221 RepID=A0A2W4ZEA9_9BACT|nr:MAG: rRNA maturation RNase YbeY [Micavibrio aeruginosavorus]
MNENSNLSIAPSDDHEIDVAVQEPDWHASHLDLEDVARTAILQALRMAPLPEEIEGRSIEVSVVLANDDLLQVLNREYRGKDKPTNVLSFAQLDADSPVPEDGPYPVGDIILSYQTIDREAKEQDKFFKDHYTHMLVHGLLHLLGFDHVEEDEANVMESLEIRILENLNIQNPYMENFSMA